MIYRSMLTIKFKSCLKSFSVAERLFLDHVACSKKMQTKQYVAASCQNSFKELDRSIHHGARVELLPLRKLPTKHLGSMGISTN